MARDWFLAFIPVVMLGFVAVRPAGADGGGSNSEWTATRQSTAVNKASNASFDHRLPPVLPGEEVKDGRATSKIWSTSGPVPVSTAPDPFVQGNTGTGVRADPATGVAPGIGVIVDQRNKD